MIPQSTDLNDMMYVRIEYMNNAEGTLVKGSNLVDAISLSKIRSGQTYSATKGVNLYLSFRALSSVSGDFVFNIWYKDIPGSGEREPTKVTEHSDFVDENLRDGDEPRHYVKDGDDKVGDDSNTTRFE